MITEDIRAAILSGQIVDISRMPLTLGEIMYMHHHPFRRCPNCEGEGSNTSIGLLTSMGIVMVPLPCEICGGSGSAHYLPLS